MVLLLGQRDRHKRSQERGAKKFWEDMLLMLANISVGTKRLAWAWWAKQSVALLNFKRGGLVTHSGLSPWSTMVEACHHGNP